MPDLVEKIDNEAAAAPADDDEKIADGNQAADTPALSRESGPLGETAAALHLPIMNRVLAPVMTRRLTSEAKAEAELTDSKQLAERMAQLEKTLAAQQQSDTLYQQQAGAVKSQQLVKQEQEEPPDTPRSDDSTKESAPSRRHAR